MPNLARFTVTAVAAALVATLTGQPAASAAERDPAGNRSITVTPEEDTSSLLRNPGMGWGLYVDTFEAKTPDADAYWKRMDAVKAPEKASFFYMRIPWVEVEPSEGNYVWRKRNSNLSALIKGARDRGLQVAFRIYYQGGDYWGKEATPGFVFDAGADSYLYDKEHRNPYANDPVFQEKYGAMVAALGEDFDDPDTTMFVDGIGLGLWGENHHEDYLTDEEKTQVYRWVTDAYSSAFQHVILGLQFGPNSFSYKLQDEAIRNHGYVMRRDSFGCGRWFPQRDKDQIHARWPATPLYAENCFHSLFSREPGYLEEYGYKSRREMFSAVVAEAKEMRANTLDLRVAEDTEAWMKEAPDLVDDFVVNGGYRFSPKSVTLPRSMNDGPFTVEAQWRNTGVGKFPNDLPQWNDKYRLAYALLHPKSGKPVYTALSDAQPAHWLKGTDYVDRTTFAPDVRKGEYLFATAIVDRDKNWKPAIELAVKEKTLRGWNVLGKTAVRDRVKSSALQGEASVLVDDAIEGSPDLLTDGSTDQNVTIQPGEDGEATARLAWDKQVAIDEITLSGPKQGRVKVSVDTFNGVDWMPVIVDHKTKIGKDISLRSTDVATSRIRVRVQSSEGVRLDEIKVSGVSGSADALPVQPQKPDITTDIPTDPSSGGVSALGDGDVQTHWRSTEDAALPGTITLSWPDIETPVDQITLASVFGQDQGVTGLDLDYWDGNSWQELKHGVELDWDHNDPAVETRKISFPEVHTKKIRLTITEANRASGGLSITDIFTSEPDLPAPDPRQPIIGTSFDTLETSGPISLLVDGDTGTPWQSDTDITLPGTITLRWPAGPVQLDKLSLAGVFAQGQAVTALDLDYWDGENWQELKHGVELSWEHNDWTLETRDIEFDAVETDRVRMTVNDANRTWGNIAMSEIIPGYVS